MPSELRSMATCRGSYYQAALLLEVHTGCNPDIHWELADKKGDTYPDWMIGSCADWWPDASPYIDALLRPDRRSIVKARP
jgi:hypothetical protein